MQSKTILMCDIFKACQLWVMGTAFMKPLFYVEEAGVFLAAACKGRCSTVSIQVRTIGGRGSRFEGGRVSPTPTLMLSTWERIKAANDKDDK